MPVFMHLGCMQIKELDVLLRELRPTASFPAVKGLFRCDSMVYLFPSYDVGKGKSCQA